MKNNQEKKPLTDQEYSILKLAAKLKTKLAFLRAADTIESQEAQDTTLYEQQRLKDLQNWNKREKEDEKP